MCLDLGRETMPGENGGLCRRINMALSPMVDLYSAASIRPEPV
jgi:hypothetical protein